MPSRQFHHLSNLKSVGDSGSGESTGHKSGRRIVKIKRTNKDDLTDDPDFPMVTWAIAQKT